MARGKRNITPEQRRYAIARARGQTIREAGKTAGLKGNRAAKGVTQAAWEKDPRVQMLIAEEVRRSMDEGEVLNILAAQARGDAPTKIIRGDRARTEYDTHSAATAVARCLGLFKEAHVGPGADGALVHEHRFGELTDEQLKARLAAKAAEAGLQVRNA